MISIKCDNRTVLKDTIFSFLSSNNLSGVTSLSLSSTSGLSADDYILVGELGSNSSEILKITSVDSITSITVPATVYAHSESTKVTRIPYNQVRFYICTTATFSAGTPLGTVDINPHSFYTQYEDKVNSTGYGFFVFLNETTSANSSPSNPSPYTGFDPNSAYSIIKRFLSSLNNSEMKLISFDDVWNWISEGYGIAKVELNLANQNYTATPQTINIISGTAEYDLDDDFSKLISVSDLNGDDIDCIKLSEVKYHNSNGTETKYYLRGNYIGFSPTPTANATYYAYFNANASSLSSYYDNIELPNDNFWILNDYLMYKASSKLGMSRQEALSYHQIFMDNIGKMKINSNKQSAEPESFDIDPMSCI